MSKKVAINGFGRIGRAILKIILENPEFELVAFNDLQPLDNLAYLLKYDSVYGRYDREVDVEKDYLKVDGNKYRWFSEKDPAKLPWKDLQVDIVFECTGFFRKKQELEKHLHTVFETASIESIETFEKSLDALIEIMQQL